MASKLYLQNSSNSTKFRVNGLVPSSRLPYKRELCQSFRHQLLYQANQLPPKVDLRPDMTPVEDQSQIGSCAANSLAGAYEYLTKKASGRNIDVSRLFIYYNARAKDQNSEIVTDSGCSMTSAIETLEEFGTCLESLWPYDISRVNTRPDDQAYQEAQYHKITEALRVNIDLYEMKSCLAQGFPFAFGLKLYTSFDQAAQTGVVPMPDAGDDGRQSDGSHALLAVGYSDQSNAFIVRNSWGQQWGDNGYCYIPYDYLTDANLCFDVWTIRQVAMADFGQDHWDNDDMINYSQLQGNNGFNYNFFGNSQFIEDFSDADANQKGSFADPWNTYRDFGGNNYSNNDNGNGYYGIYQNDDYNQNNNFADSWNPYPMFGGNTYSNNDDGNDYYGSNQSNDNQQNNSFAFSWNPYQSYKGFDYPRGNDNDQYREPFEGNFSYPSANQFRGENSFFGFRAGDSGFNGFMDNGPSFSINQFISPPSFSGYQQYGSSYGYTNDFNSYF